MHIAHKFTLVVASLLAVVVVSPAGANVVLDFETEDDFVTALSNGQKIDSEFGNLVTITSGLSTIYSSGGGHLGAAIFDSSNPGPNTGGVDGDLLVGRGNILIVQSTDSPAMTGDFFNTPNDEADGGRLVFSFVGQPVALDSIDLVDVNGNGPVTVTLFDANNLTRTYTVPRHWTHDISVLGPLGYGTLDLTTLAGQLGEGGATTSALEMLDFDANQVVRLEVDMSGSGGVDNLAFSTVPVPGAILLGALGLVVVGARRRLFS